MKEGGEGAVAILLVAEVGHRAQTLAALRRSYSHPWESEQRKPHSGKSNIEWLIDQAHLFKGKCPEATGSTTCMHAANVGKLGYIGRSLPSDKPADMTLTTRRGRIE